MFAPPPRWLGLGLGLFLASAALAASVAPQPDAAWQRFAGLALAAAIGLAIAMIPDAWARGAAAVFPAVVIVLILAGRTGVLQPFWAANTIGGAAALAAPFAAAVVLRPARRPAWRWAAGGLLATLAVLLALSRSRGAFLGLFAAGAFGALWWWSSRWGRRRLWIVGAVVIGVLALVVVGLIVAWPWAAPLIDGADVGGSDMGRLSIWRETLYLIGQAPITGWGPRAFEGGFSLYARLIRVPLFEYAHHLYLGLAFEQGIGGLAVWLTLQIAALGALLRADVRAGGSDLYRLAGLVSLLTLAVHGLLDDPVFAGGAVPLLFAGVGFAGLFGRSQPVAGLTRRALPIALGALALLAVVGVLMWTRLQAAWHVNQAALSLNAQELAHWPTIDAVTDPAPAEAELETALRLEPEQTAAGFRRGLLELNARDFAAAETDLAAAWANAPQSRAIRKALGYARLWSGDQEGAAVLLGPLPEVLVELQAYRTYWDSQDESALSRQAEQLAGRLAP